MDMSVFEGKALAEALQAAGHDVSERTVQRWIADEATPKSQDYQAIRRLLGMPDTARDAPPDWARRLTVRVRALAEKTGVTAADLDRAESDELAEEALRASGGTGRRRGGGGAASGSSV